MLEWLKKIINKILAFFWVKSEEPILEEEPVKPIEEEKENPIKEESKEEIEEIEDAEEKLKNFYDCDLVTGTMDDVDCFSEEDEAHYTFFLPVREDRETLPDLITVLYSLDNPLDGPIYEELVPLDCPGRTCVITQLTMGKIMPSDDKDGQYWYMMSAYNPRYEVIANYRGTIDCGNPDYPTMFKMGNKKVIKFTPQDYWLTEEMEKAGYSISLPVNITEDVNFCAYLYFRG